jgi:hypothetical protein
MVFIILLLDILIFGGYGVYVGFNESKWNRASEIIMHRDSLEQKCLDTCENCESCH